MSQEIWLPHVRPGIADGPRCDPACPHVFRPRDGADVFCVAWDERLRADARRRLLRTGPCRDVQRLVGDLRVAEPALVHEILDMEAAVYDD